MLDIHKYDKILSYYIGGDAEIVDKSNKYIYRGIISNILLNKQELFIYFDVLIKNTDNKWIQLFDPDDLIYRVDVDNISFSTFVGSNLFIDTGYVSTEIIELHMDGKSPFDWKGFKIPKQDDPREWEHANINAPILRIPHKKLKRSSNLSVYRSICPACNIGLLFVGRDPKTHILQEHDYCVLCGQRVIYTDIEDLRKSEGHY